ncbi:hypothetical protein Tco_0714458 [Tanacetum coccineum]
MTTCLKVVLPRLGGSSQLLDHLLLLRHLKTHNDCYHVLVIREYSYFEAPQEFWYFVRSVAMIAAAIGVAIVVIVAAGVVESLVRLAKVRLLVSWMVTDLEDSKTHTVGGVWSREYMDYSFTQSMSKLDKCYTMLQELHSVIVCGELIHKNCEGSKHESRRICPTIGNFGDNCASNQSPFNNGRIEELEEEKKED